MILMSPYVRKNLVYNPKTEKYQTQFRVPDKYGVFKFEVEFRRPGLNVVHFADEVVVRPIRLNEYERFIPAAHPYYLATGTMMLGFVLFVVLFIFVKN